MTLIVYHTQSGNASTIQRLRRNSAGRRSMEKIKAEIGKMQRKLCGQVRLSTAPAHHSCRILSTHAKPIALSRNFCYGIYGILRPVSRDKKESARGYPLAP